MRAPGRGLRHPPGAPDAGPGRAPPGARMRAPGGTRVTGSGGGTPYQLWWSGMPSVYPDELCTPTTARSWNSSREAAPA
ncbi:hypothetical protein Pve01_81840 [Planomonospora venezuelensis]|nr:hypothetical protein Pve01_81840 [Planomonospora venezuelensis]